MINVLFFIQLMVTMSNYILTLSCPDVLGVVAKTCDFLYDNKGFILESAQYSDDATQQFFMRIRFRDIDGDKALRHWQEGFAPIASQFKMDAHFYEVGIPAKLLVMVSKAGHCLNDLLHRQASGVLPAEIVGIVSNHTELAHMAKWHDIPFHHLPITVENRAEQEQDLLKIFNTTQADTLVLARYMQVLSPKLVEALYGQIINIHHSFLPGFKGAKPYQQAFDKGVKLIGATAHYASNELDEGPIIEQETIRVDHTSTPKDLQNHGRDIESTVLARALKYHCEHRVIINGAKTVVFK